MGEDWEKLAAERRQSEFNQKLYDLCNLLFWKGKRTTEADEVIIPRLVAGIRNQYSDKNDDQLRAIARQQIVREKEIWAEKDRKIQKVLDEEPVQVFYRNLFKLQPLYEGSIIYKKVTPEMLIEKSHEILNSLIEKWEQDGSGRSYNAFLGDNTELWDDAWSKLQFLPRDPEIDDLQAIKQGLSRIGVTGFPDVDSIGNV